MTTRRSESEPSLMIEQHLHHRREAPSFARISKRIKRSERCGVVCIRNAGLPRELKQSTLQQGQTFSEPVRRKPLRCSTLPEARSTRRTSKRPCSAGALEQHPKDSLRVGSWIVRKAIRNLELRSRPLAGAGNHTGDCQQRNHFSADPRSTLPLTTAPSSRQSRQEFARP